MLPIQRVGLCTAKHAEIAAARLHATNAAAAAIAVHIAVQKSSPVVGSWQ